MAEDLKMAVLKPGAFTTVQDLGRPGFQHHGVTPGGAADPFAARVANLLVGNAPAAALIELTLVGPELDFLGDALVAVTGADFRPRLGGIDVPRGRPVRLAAGTVLSFGPARDGVRAWLAIAGGLELPQRLGSRSTDVRARFGGQAGRVLAVGDTLRWGRPSVWAQAVMQQLWADHRSAPGWRTGLACEMAVPMVRELRCLQGPEFGTLSSVAQRTFFGAEFLVAPDSDRMGIRLTGPTIPLNHGGEMISVGVATGVVQLPPTGQPIILFCDRQTIGGYPRIGSVATVDQAALAQLKPGDRVRFREISLPQAHALYRELEKDLVRLGVGLARQAG